jgi:receptor protein-tyrosine kinase
MSIIEQAAKRLEELRRAGISAGGRGVAHQGSVEANSAQASPSAVQEIAAPPATGDGENEQAIPAAPAQSRKVSIDLVRLATLGFISPGDPRTPICEEYRVIKRPLIRNIKGQTGAPIRNANLVMITSALSGEGKSSVAVNLAISIAMEMDKSVLLIDADVAKPGIQKLLGIDESRGLLDVLIADGTRLNDVLLKTNIEKLSLLPSGAAQPRATELLASDAMIRLVDEMASRYPDRIIIFDSPPLLLTNEARTLAAHMGQIVVVVEAERTTHAALTQALALIEACPVKLLMLNKRRSAGSGDSYGYGGGSGYGYSGYGA